MTAASNPNLAAAQQMNTVRVLRSNHLARFRKVKTWQGYRQARNAIAAIRRSSARLAPLAAWTAIP